MKLLNHALRNSVDLVNFWYTDHGSLRLQRTESQHCRIYSPFFSNVSEMQRYIKKTVRFYTFV